jgi:hypothetical protein
MNEIPPLQRSMPGRTPGGTFVKDGVTYASEAVYKNIPPTVIDKAVAVQLTIQASHPDANVNVNLSIQHLDLPIGGFQRGVYQLTVTANEKGKSVLDKYDVRLVNSDDSNAILLEDLLGGGTKIIADIGKAK